MIFSIEQTPHLSSNQYHQITKDKKLSYHR